MLLKTKIGIVALTLIAFVAGGFALNAFDAGAFGWGMFRGIDKNSDEWQAKMEEFKAMTQEERQEQKEECKAAMEELRNSIEWQEANMEQRREMMQEAIEGIDCLFPGRKGGHIFGLKIGQFSDEVNREVEILGNGIQITITSENPDVVEKLHDFAEKINNL